MNFINQLINLLFSPLGLASLVGGLLLANWAIHSRRVAWLLFSLTGLAASLAKFSNEFIFEPPALVFPLQQLRDAGRPLTIVLLGLLLLVIIQQSKPRGGGSLPLPVKMLIGVQAVIFFKTLLYGSPFFAFLAAATFGAVVLVVRLGPGHWLNDEGNFDLAVWAMAMVGVMFLAINAYQALYDPYPLTFVHGRFLGTTGNPQHAGTLLAVTVPNFIYLIEKQSRHRWRRLAWVVGLTLVIGLLILTGSRTGLLMGVATILFFYRQRILQVLRLGLFVGGTLVLLLFLLDQNDAIWQALSTTAVDRFSEIENTRQGVWAAQWRGFEANPLFGAPLQGERMMGYGESSWLGAAAAVGLVGLAPLLLMGLGCLQMMIALYQLSRQDKAYFLPSSVVIAGLAALLTGSIFEAFLLGNLSFPLLALLFYLALGQHLLSAAQAQRTAPVVSIQSRPPTLPLRPVQPRPHSLR